MGWNKKDIKIQLSIAVVCLVVAFMITLQLKSVKINQAAKSEEQLRAESIYTELKKEREKNEALLEQSMHYKEELEAFQQQAALTGDAAKLLVDQLGKASLLAGTSEVQGSGVIVTLKDKKAESSEFGGSVVHDQDVLRIVNELKAAGAEALSINGQRLTATSEIRCAGNIISVNNTRCAAPFVVSAIGDPSAMESGLNMPGGLLEELRVWINVEIKKSDNIKIPAYAGAIIFKYAQPVEKKQ